LLWAFGWQSRSPIFTKVSEKKSPPQITLHRRMQLDIARNFAEIRNERHQEAASQVAGVGEQVTQSSSATGELLSLSAGQPGCKSAPLLQRHRRGARVPKRCDWPLFCCKDAGCT
jgi:hypothetical protein